MTLPPEINKLKYFRQPRTKINCQTAKLAGKEHCLGIRKVLNIGVKAGKHLHNENNTEDWALGSYPRDNCHATLYT